MSNDFLKSLKKEIANEYASIVEDGVFAGDIESFIDTGSYILNALLSGSIYGGMPSNKVTAIAGPTATGKTFFLLGMVKNFLESNPDAVVIYFESESALTRQMIKDRGVDITRLMIIPVTTIQEFRFQAIKVLDKYIEQPEKIRQPMLICLDSLGNLSTTKEIEDTTEGKETSDMTRARLVKGAFRVLTLKLAKAKVSLILTNHTYKTMDLFPQDIMSGGSGTAYAASTILFLSKRKEKDGTDVIGNVIHCKNFKNRLAKENAKVDVLLTYDKGLNRYYGLSELAIAAGIFKKVSTRLELPDGTKVFEKQLNNNPEKYYTDEILQRLDEAAKNAFLYGRTEPVIITEEGEEDVV